MLVVTTNSISPANKNQESFIKHCVHKKTLVTRRNITAHAHFILAIFWHHHGKHSSTKTMWYFPSVLATVNEDILLTTVAMEITIQCHFSFITKSETRNEEMVRSIKTSFILLIKNNFLLRLSVNCGEGIESNVKNHTKLFHPDLGVDFKEGGKPENSEKNHRSTGETNYNNYSHKVKIQVENQHEAIFRWSPIQL